MMIRDKINQVSTKEDLFPELSLRDKLQNRLIVFGVNIFNWIKNIFFKATSDIKKIRLISIKRDRMKNSISFLCPYIIIVYEYTPVQTIK